MAQQKQYDLFKIILVGDVSTGKTSFLTQLIHRVAERLPKPTTHLSVFTMRVSKPSAVVQIWDSPGDPKYYFQTLASISKFNSVLIFVDVINQHTYQRARIIADQIAIYVNENKMEVHVVESKIQVVQKDPLKRKVTKSMLRRISQKFNGGIFQYRQNQSVQKIIQDILQWRQRKDQLLRAQKQRQSMASQSHISQIRFQKQMQNANCECTLF